MNVHIRPAVPADAASLAHVRVAAWQAAYMGLMPEAFLANMVPEKEIPRWQENLASLSGERFIFAAEITLPAPADRQVVGFCGGGADRDQDLEYSGEVYALYVQPEFQGQGIGKQLVRAAAIWLRDHGYARFLIWVLRDNYPACRFYENLGGRAVRERSITIGGQELPEVGYGYETDPIAQAVLL
jgi:GNAT superfamily N-acetyltransferase